MVYELRLIAVAAGNDALCFKAGEFSSVWRRGYLAPADERRRIVIPDTEETTRRS